MNILSIKASRQLIYIAIFSLWLGSCAEDDMEFAQNVAKANMRTNPENFDAVPAKTVIRKFKPKFTRKDKINLVIDNNTITQEIKVLPNHSSGTSNFNQTEQIPRTKIFKQGALDSITQKFNQNTSGLIDILFVIDNSGSMRQEQINLADKLNRLLTYINDANYRIGIITTDQKASCVRAVIDRGPNAAIQFSNAVTAVGTSGSGDEKGIYMAQVGLTCSQSHWLRPGSKIAVIIVSDEDNCSNGKCPDKLSSPKDLQNTFRDINREPAIDARVYGIFSKPGMKCSSAFKKAHIYQQLVTETKGVSGNI
ncbi:MAG: hypothetical protein CMP10_07630, partial [Zetaproteobacteria bacterium]|nr:hypothetical protein [Pseudobdellovibrionaceae bacterium]